MNSIQEFCVNTKNGANYPLFIEQHELTFFYRYFLVLRNGFQEASIRQIGEVRKNAADAYKEMIAEVMNAIELDCNEDAIVHINSPYGTEIISVKDQEALLSELGLDQVSVVEFPLRYHVGDAVYWFEIAALVVGTKYKPLNHPANKSIIGSTPNSPFLNCHEVRYFDNIDMDYQIMFQDADLNLSGYEECTEHQLSMS